MDDTTRNEQVGDVGGRLAPPTISPEKPKAIIPRVDEDTQQGRILAALAKGKSLNKFDAEILGDHNLNTAISGFRIRFGIVAERCWENLAGFKNRPTRVKRYWFTDSDKQRAAQLLGWLK